MGQSYVSDIIGEEYKNWKPGDRILISTGTGSGKTWFVLRVLLGEAKRQGKHLVYFCNRKFLSLQVQAKAKSILLNELGEDVEGLAEYLHVRTYQRAEKAFDYPNIREICEDGSTGQNTEVRGKDVLYYVFDEAFYFVMDAGFNLDTHHWYDRADITANQQSVSVFLAATPEPLLMYLEFKVVKGSSLTELCKRYMARFFLNQGNDVDRWMGFLSPQYRGLMEQRKRASGDYWQTTEIDRQIKGCIEKTKQQSREPALELFEKVEHAYRSEKELLTFCYGEGRQPEEQYAYLDTHYFDDLVVLARLISDSVRENVRAASEKRNRWLIFVRTREDAMVLKENLRVLNRDAVVITADETQKYGWTPPARRSKRRKVFDALVHGERQACDILISTSVLDSGVSLHAEDVSHLVICQPNKTSFLQMLGRIRVTEGQRVNLYLQSFSPKQMRAYRNTAEQRFQTVVQALLLDEMEPRSLFPFEPGRGERMGMELLDDYVPFFPTKLREELYGNLHKDPNRGNYVYTQKRNAYEKPVRKVNPLAVLNALSEVYYVRRRMPEFDGDPYYFLKEQLSWIGKSYDPTCWIDYSSTRDDMYAYYTTCTDCGRTIHQDDAYYIDEDDYDARCYTCHCRHADQQVIHDYYYKPEPIFYGEGKRYFGVELEIDGAGESNTNAAKLVEVANHDREMVYIKHDGSLNEGMEIVTHPMTLDYHLHQMPWAAILNKAKELGYLSHQAGTCGLHIHANRTAFGDTEEEQEEVIGRILYFFEKHWEELLKFSRRTPKQLRRWADRYGLKEHPKQIIQSAKNYGDRYYCVNLCNAHTVEFRMFRGTLKLNTLIATLQLLDRICDVAICMSDEEIKDLSWTTFVAGCAHMEALVQYLKERCIYLPEPAGIEQEV